MTYKEFRDAVMHRIYSESIAGDDIESTYNNQADYLKAIPSLLNQGQDLVATTNKRIPELYPLVQPDYQTPGGFDVYTMPSDFYQLNNGGLLMERMDEFGLPNISRFTGYKLVARNKLYIPHGMQNLTAEYFRYPRHLTATPKDTEELDNTPEVQNALVTFVAANLVIYDDAFRYSSFWNEWQSEYAALAEPVYTEQGNITDAYGFGAGVY